MIWLRRIIIGLVGLALLLAAGIWAGGRMTRRSETRNGLPPAHRDVAQLANWMTGTFSTAEQSAADPASYYDVRMVISPIWPERTDGPWLYVEQALAGALEIPVRQRVYRLERQPDGAVRCAMYLIPGDSTRFAGAWNRGDSWSALKPRDLIPRDGCSFILRRDEQGAFTGGTIGKDCEALDPNAAYGTTECTVSATQWSTWDRQFDQEGNLVLGSPKGPYIYKKTSEEPPADAASQ